ncbi:MAG: hypothetical protein MJ204_02765 [Bacteroidales bacterium]|nr:hypothetical protein [Bacteroidales bacterium]MCQ2605450.1 hypothetical protein [Bacteroidales bacterium]
MNFGLIKSLIPMVKPQLPKVEEAIAEALNNVQLNEEMGEKYAGFVVLQNKPTGAKILCCAFNENDKVVRVISKSMVADFLLNLIEKAQ